MRTASILISFFGAAFLVVILAAAAVERHFRLRQFRSVRVEPELPEWHEIVEPRRAAGDSATSRSVRRNASSEESDLPEAVESTATPRAVAEMLPFRSRALAYPRHFTNFAGLLAAPKISYVPLMERLSRNARVIRALDSAAAIDTAEEETLEDGPRDASTETSYVSTPAAATSAS